MIRLRCYVRVRSLAPKKERSQPVPRLGLPGWLSVPIRLRRPEHEVPALPLFNSDPLLLLAFPRRSGFETIEQYIASPMKGVVHHKHRRTRARTCERARAHARARARTRTCTRLICSGSKAGNACSECSRDSMFTGTQSRCVMPRQGCHDVSRWNSWSRGASEMFA